MTLRNHRRTFSTYGSEDLATPKIARPPRPPESRSPDRGAEPPDSLERTSRPETQILKGNDTLYPFAHGRKLPCGKMFDRRIRAGFAQLRRCPRHAAFDVGHILEGIGK